MSLNDTPRSERLNIGIFGKRNSGKSTLINALTGQAIAVVSPIAGTTTDPVFKSMEIHGIGPVVFIDTAGFDDFGDLGDMRVDKTLDALKRTDVAILVFTNDISGMDVWIEKIRENRTPIVPVLNKADEIVDIDGTVAAITALLGEPPIVTIARLGEGVSAITESIIRRIPEDFKSGTLTHGLVGKGDSVLLVMPQDIQAPKGRLILPQVQTIRELLDLKCVVTCVTTDSIKDALATLLKPPKLIITDSQAFKTVYELKPESSLLTSFSVLMAAHKGNIDDFVSGAKAIDALTESSRVLIAEACTHAPLSEDIGREKIPKLLRQRVGEGLRVDIVSGVDFPDSDALRLYDLIIHCGACMFNRRYVLVRIQSAKEAGVAITNYGIAIAHLSGILDKIEL